VLLLLMLMMMMMMTKTTTMTQGVFYGLIAGGCVELRAGVRPGRPRVSDGGEL